MLKTQAVGIDLGTTYSCLSYLNEHGEPVTVPNQEGELSTPSVVMFDGQEVVVGTEALRNAVLKPTHVVQNSKRYIGSNKTWQIQGQTYTPVDIGALILRKMISAAEEQIGEIEQGVITVPAQFSDWQRQATVEAGVKAGLKTVDIINEPVAAALCYVLGTEGLWFSELTDEQRILVYDLGGGTFDLSLVKYHKDEVKVIASTGDLHLGGIDWNEALQNAICDRFAREFGADPRQDPESMQLLAMAVENTKRGLTVRPRAALTCTHGGHRKVYQVEQTEFEKLTKSLLDRSLSITRDLQKAYNFGLKPTDVILTTGGSSRMPMIKRGLGEIGFRTPNTSLSPDQSISHGATYYAGMLLTNTDFAKSILSAKATARLAKIKQRSVNARALGILIRHAETNTRVPHYLIPANTALPCAVEQTFGTVIPNQKRVHLHIIESGTVADQAYVELGTCVVDDLPPKLPENSLVQVTITYNEQARAVVTAKDLTSGKKAQTTIVRLENLVTQPAAQQSASVEDESQVAFTAPSIKPGQSAFGHGASGTGPQSPALPLATSTKLAPAKPSSPAPAANLPKSTTTTAASVSSPKLASAEPKRPIAGKSPSAPQSVAGPRSVLSKPSLEDASQPIPLCDECGEPLDSRGKCHACGWSVSAAKKPAIPPATAMPKASAAKPPSAAAPRKLSPPTKPVSARKKSEDADDELSGDGPVSAAPGKSATTARLADSAAPAPKPGVKPPPLPPGKTLAPPKRPQANGTNRGEEDFWVDDIQS